MRDQHGFYKEERRDTLPGPGAKKRVNNDLGGQEMRSTNDSALRAVIYVRVASAKQESPHQAEQQLAACHRAAERLGFTVVREYQDIGGSGRLLLRTLLADIQPLLIRRVIALDPSRFGRRFHEHAAVMAQLAAAGIEPPTFVHGAPTESPSPQSPSLKEVVGFSAGPEGGAR